eukprot:m.15915 g.15915  ORF g.15915 m.15915 type:complete len:602 (+) comp26629_c0_seq1:165-1970(+)
METFEEQLQSSSSDVSSASERSDSEDQQNTLEYEDNAIHSKEKELRSAKRPKTAYESNDSEDQGSVSQNLSDDSQLEEEEPSLPEMSPKELQATSSVLGSERISQIEPRKTIPVRLRHSLTEGEGSLVDAALTDTFETFINDNLPNPHRKNYTPKKASERIVSLIRKVAPSDQIGQYEAELRGDFGIMTAVKPSEKTEVNLSSKDAAEIDPKQSNLDDWLEKPKRSEEERPSPMFEQTKTSTSPNVSASTNREGFPLNAITEALSELLCSKANIAMAAIGSAASNHAETVLTEKITDEEKKDLCESIVRLFRSNDGNSIELPQGQDSTTGTQTAVGQSTVNFNLSVFGSAGQNAITIAAVEGINKGNTIEEMMAALPEEEQQKLRHRSRMQDRAFETNPAAKASFSQTIFNSQDTRQEGLMSERGHEVSQKQLKTFEASIKESLEEVRLLRADTKANTQRILLEIRKSIPQRTKEDKTLLESSDSSQPAAVVGEATLESQPLSPSSQSSRVTVLSSSSEENFQPSLDMNVDEGAVALIALCQNEANPENKERMQALASQENLPQIREKKKITAVCKKGAASLGTAIVTDKRKQRKQKGVPA